MFLLALCALPVQAQVAAPELLSPVRDSYPQLSPDGARLVFQSNRDGSNQLWLMNRDGSGLRQLTHLPGEGAETPKWSPDGGLIAYAAYLGAGNNDVFVMNPDGSGTRQVTHGQGYDDHPHWTADGNRLVFNSDRETPDPTAPWERRWHDIWSVAVDGSDLQRHTRCRTACTYGSLSPDGAWLLYRQVDDSVGLNWVMEAGQRNSEIYLARADGSEPRVLASHPAFDGWPGWSPDGAWIAFASNRGSLPRSAQLWRVRPDGTGLQQLTFGDFGHVQPSWSADGSLVTAFRFQETDQAEHGGIAIIPVSLPAH